MNPGGRIIFVLLLFLSFCFPAFALTSGGRTVTKTYYQNGKLKSVTVTRVFIGRNIDLFNYYKKTKVICTEFDSITGRKNKYTKRITQIGRGTKPCYELYYRQVDYDANGERLLFQEFHCDKRRTLRKEYREGKVIFIRKKKPKRRLWW